MAVQITTRAALATAVSPQMETNRKLTYIIRGKIQTPAQNLSRKGFVLQQCCTFRPEIAQYQKCCQRALNGHLKLYKQ
ncbi:hypothetical protein [Comamonas odontotermitis]|uniref:hypothetical protein n=1 Tax=Comamonas odontotermitis TaxID=379895 RepID=UPI001CC61697|nr:hypothetical protein [Comamonas odontotermitis]UBB18926.1 hypothetical protein LAD35_10030 [Comamonas odontotermitis]